MKKTLTFLFLLVLINQYDLMATIRVVNNRTDLPVNPGQFLTIQAAIDASSSGDTILVSGSPNVYDGFNLNKKLTLIGPGYNPDKQFPSTATIKYLNSANNASIILNSVSASYSSITGFILTGNIVNQKGIVISNLSIRRNYFNSRYGWSVDFTQEVSNDILIAENIFDGNGVNVNYSANSSNKVNNFKVENNVFFGNGRVIGGYYNNINLYVNHNLFIRGDASQPLYSSFNGGMSITGNSISINDNIFYNVLPLDTTATYTLNCNLTNNITFAGVLIPNLPYGKTNVGSSNINNIDPEFLSIFNTNKSVDLILDNIRLKSTSPAHNAATDGTDIGPTGGKYPIYQSNRYLTGEPPIPEVKSINFVGASSTKPGGVLKLEIKAKKIN